MDANTPTMYKVLTNSYRQYSIYPFNLENPLGWKETDKIGTKDECLDYINKVWVDI